MSNSVYIRADGGNSIGLGHLVRCVSLAYILRAKYIIYFVCKEIPLDFEREFRELGINILKINTEEEFLQMLPCNSIVVLDHYSLGSKYQKTIKEIGCKLVCIDDMHNQTFYADLIINHTPGVQSSDYDAQPYTDFALGLEYALLRPVFLDAARKTRVHNDSRTVFICFGGSDPKNLTLKALQAAFEIDFFSDIVVVSGAANSNLKTIEETIAKHDSVKHFHNLRAEEMLKLMMKAGVVIVPASGILLEALSLKCKVISGMYIENQRYIFEAFRKSNCIFDAATFSKIDIKAALMEAASGVKLAECDIDGYTSDRILSKFSLWD